MVGHHAGREGVAGRGDEDASELGEEEVRVRGDGVVELGLAEGEKGGVLLRGGLGVELVSLTGMWGSGLGWVGRLAVFSKRAS